MTGAAVFKVNPIADILDYFGLSHLPLEKGLHCWEADGIVRSNTSSNTLHEIAHYQLASSERRNLVNFGLGNCPDEKGVSHPSMDMTYDKTYEEEKLASVLGIMMEKHLGLDWMNTYLQHAWGDIVEAGDIFSDYVKKLQDMGFLSGEIPTFKKA